MSGIAGVGMNVAERSMLFVPAVRWSMLEKAARSDADAVCLDLEDSVPAADKIACRANVVRALNELDFGRKLRIARINGLATPYAFGDLEEVVRGAAARLDLVMVPKVGSPLDVALVATLLGFHESQALSERAVGIEAQIESAAGFVNVNAIASASPRLATLVLGAGDYAASLHMPASGIGTFDSHDAIYPGHRYHALMHGIVAAARANGVRCVDGPYSAHTDVDGFRRACMVARVMGFDGKQCIHPSQIAVVNEVFSPSIEEIDQARRVVEAYEKGAAQGRGAVVLDGRMVDEANVRMARVVLDRAQLEISK